MLVLALDTTTLPGSCALARDGVVIAEAGGDEQRSHAERLPRELMQLLESDRIALADVDAFAVATGPGSFTGLRVGIATMQGLAFAAGRPLFGISALDALSAHAGDGLVATWIDAWRGEVYAALYDNGRATGETTVGLPDDLLAAYPPAPIRFIGDGAITHWQRIVTSRGDAVTLASPPVPRLAGTIALLANGLAAGGARPAPDAIEQLYVRRPDANPARDAKPGR
jgi:tRNA threonylcarbamoyladenosine biosynthesis protein TsaB